MKRFAILALLAPALALAQPLAPIRIAVGPSAATTQTANSAAGNEPALAADGLNIQGLSACRVVLSAASGQTLSGAGTLRFWYYDTSLARWILNQDVTIPVTTSSRRDMVSQDYQILISAGRVYVEADTVTSSSGALTVTLHCWRQR